MTGKRYNAITLQQNMKGFGLKIYDYPNRPMPLLDGRLVSYFVSENLLSWYSFPMTQIIDIIYYENKISLTDINDTTKEESNVILYFNNEQDAYTEYLQLLKLQRKWYGEPYNCNDVPMPEF
jgi:hypothetical protein